MKRLLLIATMILCTSLLALAQTVKVHGTVIDSEFGDPIPGVTVLELGTQNGTVTDFDGNYELTVKADATLQFSYIGYVSQQHPAASKVDVTMAEDSQMLEEMVVTGYTVQRKADLTGSVAVVSVGEMKKMNENNPMKALQGRVPGMNISASGAPSGESTVRIRGIGTLNNNDPLYIIDGVPTKSGMHELNGNDIESIQVLKDAASASIYGSRAANGVIIITTKKGKEGTLKVDFDASVSMSKYVNKMDVLNAKEFGQVMWQAYVNDGLNPNRNGLGYHYDWSYGANGAPVLNNVTMDKYLDQAGITPAGDTDWFDQVTRTGMVQQYNLSISQGSEKGHSLMSLGYYKNNGIIKMTDFDRFSARINSDYNLLNNHLTVGENFTVNRTSEVQAPGGFLQNALQFNPSIPVHTTDGGWGGPVGGYPDRQNPLARLTRASDDRYTLWRMFGDVSANVKLPYNINLRSTFGVDYSQKQQRFFKYPVTEGTVANEKNAVEAKQEHWMKWMWNAIGTWNFEKGKHRGDVMVGMEVNRQDDMFFSGYKEGFYILTPDYMWPNAGSGNAQAYGGGSGFSLVSFFGKANYTYNNKYLASLTVRRDGSSRFGKNNQYGTFPSVSLGWRLNQESWMESTRSWLDELKLRASWGMTGNQEIDNNARYTIFVSNYGQSNFGGSSYGTAYDIAGTNGGHILDSGFKRDQLGNDDIKWEATTQTNLGFDFSAMNNSIYGNFDWYYKKTDDILLRMIGIAAMGEGSSQWINAGSVENKGWELQLGYRKETSFGLMYDISGNIGSYRNKVTKLPDTVASEGTFGGNKVKSVVGHAMGSQVGYVADGIFKSQEEVENHAEQQGAGLGRIRWKDLNHDGKITEEDQKWIYNPVPDFSYGLNIYLQYKQWDFTMFFQGEAGRQIISDLKKETDLWAGLNISNLNKGARLLDAWSPNNPNSDIPALTLSDNNNEKRVSSYFVENGSYCKLRNLQIGYVLSEKAAKACHMERLRLYVSAQNLFTIKSKDFTGVDPENPNFDYPIPFNMTVGLNMSF
ncbi:MAG: TonB-dependent receptor [Bacteroidales bacterium]|nr:TonB-dependent receptor [Candidatus Liminaster caballi]